MKIRNIAACAAVMCGSVAHTATAQQIDGPTVVPPRTDRTTNSTSPRYQEEDWRQLPTIGETEESDPFQWERMPSVELPSTTESSRPNKSDLQANDHPVGSGVVGQEPQPIAPPEASEPPRPRHPAAPAPQPLPADAGANASRSEGYDYFRNPQGAAPMLPRGMTYSDQQAQQGYAGHGSSAMAPMPLPESATGSLDWSCGGCQQAESFDCFDGNCPSWDARFNAVFMQRENPDGAVLMTGGGGAPTLLNANQFAFDYEQAYDFSLGRSLGNGFGWEARYFVADEWNSTRTFLANGPAFATTPLSQLANVQTVTSSYTSDLHTIEVNARQQVLPNWSVLAGFRYANLDELLTIGTRDAGNNTSTAAWLTRNDLYGFQIGADGTLWQNCCGWRVLGTAKGGVYYNDASAQTSLASSGAGGLAGIGYDENDRVAFLGELGMSAAYRFGRNWEFQVGYQAMWFEGVTLAGEQVGSTGSLFTPNIGLNANSGGAFYHGAFAGLTFSR